MEKISLFPVNVYKFKVDPTTYDKQHVIETCLSNYQKASSRNYWDEDSILHHTYNDWDNDDFQKINQATLVPLYIDACVKVLPDLKLRTNVVNLHVNITNISTNAVYMKGHNHFGGDSYKNSFICLLTGVHYLSLDQKQKPTIFMNPALGFELHKQTVDENYIDEYFSLSSKLFDSSKEEYSFYGKDFCLPMEEDDIVLFPTHLNHYVKNNPASFQAKPRIVVAFNIMALL